MKNADFLLAVLLLSVIEFATYHGRLSYEAAMHIVMLMVILEAAMAWLLGGLVDLYKPLAKKALGDDRAG